MSSQIQPGGLHGANLAGQVPVDVLEPGVRLAPGFAIPKANAEFNRRMNWERAAQMEREERGNLSWWSTKK